VELHGGVVTARSEGDGKGTTFTITLPCVGVSTPLPGSQSHLDVSRIGNDGWELRGVRILAVEDDSDSREMLEMVLKSQGAEVVSVNSVKDALRVLEGNGWKPQILVSDLGMPELDGYDLIRRMRLESNYKSLPAIAITGYAGHEEGKRTFEAGFQKHLTKPVTWRELIDAIVELT
jgi:CheY-like chemotaxis protein